MRMRSPSDRRHAKRWVHGYHCRQSSSAQSLVELQAGIIILIPVLLVLLDLSVCLLGVQRNDDLCRNAARAAASGDPAEAKSRAQAVVARYAIDTPGAFVSKFVLLEPIDLKITSKPALQIDPRTGNEVNPGGPVCGTARVSTEVDVRPFIVHMVWSGKSPLKFRSQHTFPLSYVMPSSISQPRLRPVEPDDAWHRPSN